MPTVDCPHCGEPTDTFPDPGVGAEQNYVEDCVVCCKPIRFIAIYSEDDNDFAIEVREV